MDVRMSSAMARLFRSSIRSSALRYVSTPKRSASSRMRARASLTDATMAMRSQRFHTGMRTCRHGRETDVYHHIVMPGTTSTAEYRAWAVFPPYLVQDEVEEVLVQLALAVQLHGRDHHALLNT